MNDEQLLRYSRQIMLPEIDAAGQQKLTEASALIIGLGGLGSPASIYLASAGVGRLVIVDYDKVDLSNLQRQIVHTTNDIGRPKVDSAGKHSMPLIRMLKLSARIIRWMKQSWIPKSLVPMWYWIAVIILIRVSR